MDLVIKVPGLQHISEDIFKLLDKNSLMNCRLTNSSWKNISKMSVFWLKKMKMEGWTTLAKHIEDRQIAKVFRRCSQDLEKWRSVIQSKWKVLLTKLEHYHKTEDYLVLILIKIYNNRPRLILAEYDDQQILLPLEIVSCLTEAYKYPDLVEALLEHVNSSSKVDIVTSDYFFWIALVGSTTILQAAFDGFTELVEKLSKKYEDSVVETSHG